jgi:hypothetical protein
MEPQLQSEKLVSDEQDGTEPLTKVNDLQRADSLKPSLLQMPLT